MEKSKKSDPNFKDMMRAAFCRGLMALVCAGVTACTGTEGVSTAKVRKSLGEQMRDNLAASIANVPSELLGGAAPNAQNAKHITASTQEEMMSSAESGAVYYTDAHDPDAPIPGLEEAFARRKENERWIQSYSAALREAQRTGKAILIWFHHSKGSPPSKKLGEELLQTSDFEEWAKENIVRVCYDQAEEFENERIAKKKRKMRDYVRAAPARFGVRGTPVLLVMAPDGTRVDTMRGYYTGQSRLYFDQIKHDAKLAQAQYEGVKKTLIPKGYRTWKGANGNTLFAKFARYSEKTNWVWLQEFDGHLLRTRMNSLCDEDQSWVMERHKQESESRNKRSTSRPKR